MYCLMVRDMQEGSVSWLACSAGLLSAQTLDLLRATHMCIRMNVISMKSHTDQIHLIDMSLRVQLADNFVRALQEQNCRLWHHLHSSSSSAGEHRFEADLNYYKLHALALTVIAVQAQQACRLGFKLPNKVSARILHIVL